jgi:low affinity Fe/Cu permease
LLRAASPPDAARQQPAAVYGAMPAPTPPAQSSRHGPAWFSRFARWTSQYTGRPGTFVGATLVILVWAVTGPVFHYSETWPLVINTGTTIVTFLMVFLIQNTQKRDSQALHVKPDELIRAMKGASNRMIDLDHLTDEELDRIRRHYAHLARKSPRELHQKAARRRTPALHSSAVAAGRPPPRLTQRRRRQEVQP